MKNLVIVESPAKARTIERYLGPGYKVMASYGHVRQLPSKQGSVDVEHDFEPKYEVITGNKKHVAELKKALKDADKLLLATDLDREGEAIAWHLTELLKPKKDDVSRITFNEITKPAIQRAIEDQHEINSNLVEAQETRQTLDYLYGFTLSPFLWKKVRYGLSAGRVQSVALRLIVEREREIEAFKPEEYWTLETLLKQSKESNEKLATFAATLTEDQGKKLSQFDLTAARAKELAKELPAHPVSVKTVEKKDRKRSPAPPFTTSTLQQEASRKLGFAARRTMRTAQTLYEDGLITYMRTDSVNLAASAVTEAREAIATQYGAEFRPDEPRYYKNRSKGAQEAHEAIRPTTFNRSPKELEGSRSADEVKLYRLIWQRALASQMADAVMDQTTATMSAGDSGHATLKATGSVIKFAGFMKVYLEGRDDAGAEDDEKLLPMLSEGDDLELLNADPEQHFTSPPPRYTEASLVKTLEEYGIGRPSTYASIISTLQDRKYVRLEERRFFPEETGMLVSDILTEQFAQYVDYGFTADLENKLDDIAEGNAHRVETLKAWWGPFNDAVKNADPKKPESGTGRTCPKCEQGEVMKKFGRYGWFYGCSRYPDCDYMAPLEEEAEAAKEAEQAAEGETCPIDGAPMTVKRGRFGMFLACTNYPECKGTKPLAKSTEVTCPKCKEGELVEKRSRRGKVFYGCNRYPKCDFASWQEPVKEPCPKCGNLVTKRGKSKIACTECDFSAEVEPAAA